MIVLLVPGFLARLPFYPIFRENVLEMEQAHPRRNFHLGFDAFHLLTTVDQLVFQSNRYVVTCLINMFTINMGRRENQSTRRNLSEQGRDPMDLTDV